MATIINTRIRQKHDLELNWLTAKDPNDPTKEFVPNAGEIIIYDRETDSSGKTLTLSDGTSVLPVGRTAPYTYERFKIGDGITTASNLPFAVEIETSTNGYITVNDRDINVYTHPTGADYEHIPDGGVTGDILRWFTNGKAIWGAEKHNTHSINSGKNKNDSIDIIGSASNEELTLGDSGVTGGTYGPTSDQTPTYGATFTVPEIKVNSKGIVTSVTNRTVQIPASDNTNDNQTVKTNNVTFGINDAVEFAAGSNVTISGDAANKKITISATDIDTKNTAGATDTSSKIFLIGATSQEANPQTYSHDTAYVDTNGCLYSEGKKVSVENHGNHVPTTETADNQKFLRNDNTWQKVTPGNIGAAPTSHSVTGATYGLGSATTNTSSVSGGNYGHVKLFNGSLDQEGISATEGVAAGLGHTHNYVVKNTDISGDTKCKITYDSKGLVTAGADLTASDIPVLDSNKINSMTDYRMGSSTTDIFTTDTLNTAIGKLEYKLSNIGNKTAGIQQSVTMGTVYGSASGANSIALMSATGGTVFIGTNTGPVEIRGTSITANNNAIVTLSENNTTSGSFKLQADELVHLATASGDARISMNEDSINISATEGAKIAMSDTTQITNDVTVNGIVTATAFNANSDARLKKNIIDYVPSNSIIDLPVKEFDYVNSDVHTIGCIAQDLQELFPELVTENSDTGYLSIAENKLVYLLLLELKQVKAELNQLKAKLDEINTL